MTKHTVKDGTEIYFKDWGTGTPVVFSHGWPLNADAWDSQMLFLGQHGYRVIAHDRRGHGRSGQPWHGNDIEQYADDLAEVLDCLDVNDAVLVGHSTGGGEVVRYLGKYGSGRVRKAILIGAVPPLMIKTPNNRAGLPIQVFNGIRAGVKNNRSQYFLDLSFPFYGYNRPNARPSKGVQDSFWLAAMMTSIVSAYDCIKAFSETDFTEDLKSIEIPVLLLHGDDDQIVPIQGSALLSLNLLKEATLKILPGAPHGVCTTNADTVNQHILNFLHEF